MKILLKIKPKSLPKKLLKVFFLNMILAFPGFALVKDVDSAVTEARKLGFPFVAKIVSPQILHKTDVGGVKIDLKDEESC